MRVKSYGVNLARSSCSYDLVRNYKNNDRTIGRLSNQLAKVILLLVILFLGAGVVYQLAGNDTARGAAPLQIILVQTGDTLWSLSDSYAGKMDRWEWIEETKRLNHLPSNEISGGSKLRIHDYR